MNNLNTRLTRLEDFARGDDEELMGGQYPTMPITIREMLETLKDQAEHASDLARKISAQGSGINASREVAQWDKHQTLNAMCTVVGWVQEVQPMAFEM
eukprot:2512728-Ditylum_brightwellii.AAC.1